MRLKDADELKEWVENWFEKNRYYHPHSKANNIPIPELYDILERMPTVEAEPIRHGQWELSPFDGNWTCSKCGNNFRVYPYHNDMKNMNYCPNCGAKMDGGNT